MKTIILSLLLALSVFAFGQTYNVTDFGAVGNGSTVNTAAIQAAIDTCTITGGTVLIPSGTFVTGTIVLKSNVTLEVNGTLQGSTNINHYPDFIPALRSMSDENTQKAIIYAEQQHNITIRGSGTLNGNGFSFLGASDRPYGIRLISCNNVLYENIELQNAAFWMMHNLDIDSLTIRNITISNNSNSNNDGIGIDACRNVLIENCNVSSLDDPLVFKTTTPLNTENVVVQNCTLSTVARAIKIGTETTGGFRNILIKDIVVQPGILTADCGINIAIVDGGFIDSLTLQNITITGVNTALMIRLGNQARPYTPGAPIPGVGSVKNVLLKNITITAESNLTSTITGIPGYYAENITLQDVTINFPGGSASLSPGFVVPENETERPNCDILGDSLPAHGLYIRHVKNIIMENVCFNADAADQRPGLVMEDVLASPQYAALEITPTEYCIQELPSGVRTYSSSRLKVVADANTKSMKVFMGEFSSERIQIIIYDLAGRIVLEKNVVPKDMIELPFTATRGTYLCSVKTESAIVNRKFVLQ